ncbi:MAG: DUF6252 family protein [Bergeyella sp.]
MKNILFLAILSIGLLSCKDDDQNPNVLPEATQSGKNTAGALVDGKVWVATTKQLDGNNGGTHCNANGNNYRITLDLRKDKDSYNNAIYIDVLIPNMEINKLYEIINQTPDNDFNYAIYTNGSGKSYSTNSNYTGKIKITRIDIQNQIVSGTFEFNAVDKDGNVVDITDGRFDKKFD